MLFFVILFIAILLILIIRLSCVLPKYRQINKRKKLNGNKLKTMIVFGSGGHTTEMLKLITRLSIQKYGPVHYVLAQTDITSMSKIKDKNLPISENAIWEKIYRSREVKQSWISTIFSTILACFHSIFLLYTVKPDLIIVNGPGTCVPICYSAFLFRILYIFNADIIFAESFCRVKYLSMTGKLLYPIADKFIVQWEELQHKYSRAEYIGKIC
jgi:beta-1,4-N-acetylglucosaminyltransferase